MWLKWRINDPNNSFNQLVEQLVSHFSSVADVTEFECTDICILSVFFFVLFFFPRLGSKLPPGVSQPPQFAKGPWETQPQARVTPRPNASSQRQNQPAVGRPLNHIPHIRNPKLRQYYLQGTVPLLDVLWAGSRLSSSNLHFMILILSLLAFSCLCMKLFSYWEERQAYSNPVRKWWYSLCCVQDAVTETDLFCCSQGLHGISTMRPWNKSLWVDRQMTAQAAGWVTCFCFFFLLSFQSLSNSLRAPRDSALGTGKRRTGKLDRDISLHL